MTCAVWLKCGYPISLILICLEHVADSSYHGAGLQIPDHSGAFVLCEVMAEAGQAKRKQAEVEAQSCDESCNASSLFD